MPIATPKAMTRNGEVEIETAYLTFTPPERDSDEYQESYLSALRSVRRAEMRDDVVALAKAINRLNNIAKRARQHGVVLVDSDVYRYASL